MELYSHIVEYQASTVCHLSKAQISRAWENVAGSNDWDGRAKKIEELNQNCKEIIGLSKDRKVNECWKNQLETMQRSEESLRRIEMILTDSEMQTQKIYEDQLERSLFEELASDYSGDKNFNPRRSEGTCEWFFKDDRFRHWRDNSTSGLLWVSAGPGCGKSVLSRALIDERRLLTSVTTSKVCYFFFKDGDEQRQHSADALRAILHQIFAQDSSGSLIKKALDSHKKFGKSLRQMFSELWQILLDCSQSPDAGEVICVLDALDECNVDSRRELIDHVENSCCRSHISKLKFLITSRPYIDLDARFNKISDKAGYQHLSGDDKSKEIGKEINIVIDDWVRNFTDYNDEDRRQISECVKRKENRTYLWLHLTIKGIEQSGSERVRDVLDILDELPEKVSDKYEKILERSSHHNRTKILLQIVLSAAEPLTLDQANVALALALDNQITSYTEMKSKLWPNFEKTVTNLCGLFISVHDKKLYFIHLTAREFLLSSKRRNRWEGCFEMSDSHGSILRSCLDFLLLPDLPDLTNLSDSFIEYAAEYWPWHFSSYSGNEKVSDLALNLCDESSKSFQNWYPIYKPPYGAPGSANPLLIAAYLGLEALIKQLLKINKADINSKDSRWHRTPLSWAVVKGHTIVVEQLLNTGKVEVDSRDIWDSTPFSEAVNTGHEAIVKRLLAIGEIDVDSRDIIGFTPLSKAATGGYEAIVKHLLDTGKVNVNSRSDGGDTPLSKAVTGGHKAVVKQLLNIGKVDVNARDNEGITPLSEAVMGGHEAIVKQLLNTGKVDVDAKDDHGEIPLSHAEKRGYKVIVEHLQSYKDSQLVRDSRGP